MRDLTVEDVATQLDVSTETVRRYLRTGELKGYRFGGRKAGWRIPQDAIDDFRAERLERPKEEPSRLNIDWDGEQGKQLRSFVEALLAATDLPTIEQALADMWAYVDVKPAGRYKLLRQFHGQPTEERDANKQTSGT